MKKFPILILCAFLLTGCINIKESSYSEIINETINSKEKIYNTYRTGYKFYLPNKLYVDNKKEYNEIIRTNYATYYLYIDLIGYLNKVTNEYEIDNSSYYSQVFSKDNIKGYIEINQKDEKFLVEILYNYAKIEVMVDEKDINEAVANSMVILSSIYYNDKILANLSTETLLTYSEENVDIFSNSLGSENSNFLEYIEDDYTSDEEIVPDYDLIN